MDRLLRVMLWGSGLLVAGLASILILVAIALAVAFPNLPDISDLSDYRPKLPLRVYSAEGILIGEFGEERRHLTPIKEIPKIMINAVLAVEDARFYEQALPVYGCSEDEARMLREHRHPQAIQALRRIAGHLEQSQPDRDVLHSASFLAASRSLVSPRDAATKTMQMAMKIVEIRII